MIEIGDIRVTEKLLIAPDQEAKIRSEYDQEILQLQTEDKAIAPRGRATQPS